MKIYGTESNVYILKELGKRIQDARISMSITQKQLAENAGISASTMERIENGENVKVENILNVMRALSLLSNLEILIPEQEVVPSVMLDLGGRKKRVSLKRVKNVEETEWKWGDEP